MVAAEAALPQWGDTATAIGEEIEMVGQLMESATDEMAERDKRGAGFAGRLTVAKQLAQQLAPRAHRILRLSNKFTSQLNDVDGGIRHMIMAAPSEVEENPNVRKNACEFFESIYDMAKSANDGLGAIEGMVTAIQPLESMSRDLRPPLRTMRKGLTVMQEGRNVASEWISLIEQSPLDCSDVT